MPCKSIGIIGVLFRWLEEPEIVFGTYWYRHSVMRVLPAFGPCYSWCRGMCSTRNAVAHEDVCRRPDRRLRLPSTRLVSCSFRLLTHTQRRSCLILGRTSKVKVAHTRLPSVGFWSWSRFLAVSLQVTWVINPAVGCRYFPPGLHLPPQP